LGKPLSELAFLWAVNQTKDEIQTFLYFYLSINNMAHKKAAGAAKNLRDSQPKYRGIKLFGGQRAVA
jgi:hypothetical protein